MPFAVFTAVEKPDRAIGDAVDYSMALVKRHPLITYAQEIELGRQVRAMMEIVEAQGCKAIFKANRTGNERVFAEGLRAREKLLKSNLRLVRGMVKNYAHKFSPGFTREDAIAEGDCGLLRAIELFDPERGYKFSTYATWWIRQAITRIIPITNRVIRLPAHIYEKQTKIARALDKLPPGLTPEETTAALVKETGLPPEHCTPEYRQYLSSISRGISSLDACVASDLPLLNTIPSDEDTWDYAEQRDIEREVAELIAAANLSDKAKEVLAYRYGLRVPTAAQLAEIGSKKDPTSYWAVGAATGLSRERARTTHSAAMRAIRREIQRSD